MENVITFIVSTLVQTVMSAYFVFSMAKLFDNKDFSKKQTIIATFIFAFIGPFTQILKYYFPTIFPILSIPFTIIMLFIITYFILKTSIAKSLFISILMLVLVAITELIAVFFITNILKCDANSLLKRPFTTLLIILPQNLLAIFITKLITIIFDKKRANLKFNITNVSYKQIILFGSLLIIYIFPQMILMITNRYSYSNSFLIINTIQFVLIVIFLTVYLKKSLEHEKVQMDLYTSELHNKTLVGMVDGVRTLKHDYNNIIQALNGYVTTKQYDKLAEHINGVLKECNIINNLSVIDPKIFNEPAIYGVVGAKYFLANKDNITFDLDIMTNITKINFSMPDLSRILGILLDNALEATKKSNKPYMMLEMKYNKRKNADVIRIINTYDTNIQIDLNKIYEKGFSTKEVKSGIGLWEVKKLISRCKNSQVFATIEKDKFVQNIIIEKTE